MKPKQKVKIVIDLFMTILLLVLMIYPVTGQLAHERAGAGMLRRMTGKPSKGQTAIARCVGLMIGLYGVYSIWTHQIWQYLFLRTEFVWMDPEWSDPRFLLDHLAMMGLLILLAHCAMSLGRKGAART